MKSLAVIIAAFSLAAGAAFAGGVEAGKIEGKVKTEGQVESATGAQVNGQADVTGAGVRSSSTSKAATGNIISKSLNAQGAAKEIGGTCEPGAFDSLSVAERAQVKMAVQAGLAGDRCAKQFDSETVKTVAQIDGGMLEALKATGASSATDAKLSVNQKAGLVVAGAKRLASKINVRVSEAVARLRGTCEKACDTLSSALCAPAVLNAADAQAASL